MKRTLFILAMAFITCVAGATKAQEASAIDERIAMIGDLNAEYLGKSLAPYAERDNATLIQTSQRGSSVLDWNEHPEWFAWIDEFSPTLVIIVLGASEAEGSRKTDELAPFFAKLFESLSGDGRRVVWVKPLATAKRKNAAAVSAAIQSTGATWLDSNESVKLASNVPKHDDYDRWAKYIALAIGL